MKRYDYIYLSPHYDDIALSCGGTIHRQTQAGRSVLGVTICAAAPNNARFSAFAEAMHQNWGNPADAVATRQVEDEAALKILGADFHRLPFLDCIYRGNPEAGSWYYNSDSDLFGKIHPDDLPLAYHIAAAVIDLVPDNNDLVIYAPLTVGHHVDHQLTHAAAWQLHAQGYSVIFYEDYPYVDPHYPFTRHGADNEYDLEAALAASRPLRLGSELSSISPENLQAKIKSVGAYASQLQILFGGEAAMERYVTAYASQVGQGNLAERVWVPITNYQLPITNY
jgi:LmbE family N-acetylglucosaminyl deacetylase